MRCFGWLRIVLLDFRAIVFPFNLFSIYYVHDYLAGSACRVKVRGCDWHLPRSPLLAEFFDRLFRLREWHSEILPCVIFSCICVVLSCDLEHC